MSMYASFEPPKYGNVRGKLNPMMWGQLNAQMSGEPTAADWAARVAGMQGIGQGFKDTLNFAKSDYAGRGVFDSGWMGQEHGRLLNQKAGQEAGLVNQFWNNIMMRQMQATGMAGNVIAGARAGSGRYTWEG